MANASPARLARRPFPLGMSYPHVPTIHAAHPGSAPLRANNLRRRAPHAPLDTRASSTCVTRGAGGCSDMALRHHRPAPAVAHGIARVVRARAGLAADGGPPGRCVTGVRFDVLELPAEAGVAVLRASGRSPAGGAATGTMRLLVAAGSAESCRGCWTGWSGAASPWIWRAGRGRSTPAPAPPGGRGPARGPPSGCGLPGRGATDRGRSLPTLPAGRCARRSAGCGGDGAHRSDAGGRARDRCHRIRLRGRGPVSRGPSRTPRGCSAGTRPRSLTS